MNNFRVLSFVIILSILLTSCTPASTIMTHTPVPLPTSSPEHTPTFLPSETAEHSATAPPTETLEPTGTFSPTALPPLGEPGNPLTIVILPGEQALTQIDLVGISSLIMEEVGASVALVQAASAAEAGQMLCNGDAEAAVLDTPTYLQVHALGCAEAFLSARSDRSNHLFGQIVANASSGISSIADLSGKRFCRTSEQDFLNWVVPAAMMSASGLQPELDLAEIIDLGDDLAVIRSIYAGECDAGAVNLDAREALLEEITDVMDTVEQVETYQMPRENISFVPGLSQEFQDGLIRGFLYLSTYLGGQAIQTLYGWDSLLRIDNSYYKDLRTLLIRGEIGPAQSGLNVAIEQYEEFFDGPESLLQVKSADAGSQAIDEGEYLLSANESAIWATVEHRLSDLVIEVDVRFAYAEGMEPDQDWIANLRCREQENGDGYRFLLNGAGEVGVIRVMDYSQVEWLMNWQAAPQVNPAGETNRLKAVCTLDRLEYFVNGAKVFFGQDATFTTGVPGLGTAALGEIQAMVTFDNLFVGGRK